MSDERPRVTIASDEDVETGFLLADEHTRAMTQDERLAAFADQGRLDWGEHYDPTDLDGALEPRPFTWADEETLHATRDGEEPDEWWFVIPDLPAFGSRPVHDQGGEKR